MMSLSLSINTSSFLSVQGESLKNTFPPRLFVQVEGIENVAMFNLVTSTSGQEVHAAQ